MEIERKFLIKNIPHNLENYEKHEIKQGYLCTEPVLRIRQLDETYIITYKSNGLRTRIEEEMPLTKNSFEHLLSKTDGNIIHKTRYIIPDEQSNLTIELDCFHGIFEGLWLAEVEFPTEATADQYAPVRWFAKDVTYDGAYHNSNLSSMSQSDIASLIKECQDSIKL